MGAAIRLLKRTRLSIRVGLYILAMGILSTVFLLQHPSIVQGEKNSCPLTVKQETAAVKAFKGLAPVFQEPRCLNCHGAVNPFSKTGGHGGGPIDIRKETQEFLKMPDFQNFLTAGSDPDGVIRTKTLSGLKEIAESLSEVTDNDLIRQKAFNPMRETCKECHIFAWIIPMRQNYFLNKSAKDMCIHIKTSSLTNDPGSFLRHIQDDELVLEGFKGKRGLLEAVAPAPPKISFATVEKFANDWIEAMGGKFHQPPDCGCVIHGDYVLEFQSVIVSTRKIDWAQSHASAVVRLEAQDDEKSEAEPKYSGQGNMTYQTGPLPNWNPCLPLIRGQGTVPFRVYQAFIHVDDQQNVNAASKGRLAKIELLYGILGLTQEIDYTGQETFIEEKNSCVPGQPQFYPFWSPMYLSGREAETTGEDMFLLKDWTYVGQNGVVATKTLRSTCGGACDQEISTFTLKEGDGSEASPPK